MGKTATVLCIADHMLSAQQEILSAAGVGKSAKSRLCLTKLEEAAQKCEFKVVNIHGMRWGGDEEYRTIGCQIGIFNEGHTPSLEKCKIEVLRHFRKQVAPRKTGGKRTCMTVMVIDEMDVVPKGDLIELLTIAGTGCGGSGFEEGKKCDANTSSLIVIGISNSISYPLGLRMDTQALPRTFVFQPYSYERLVEIIFRRSFGLFSHHSMTLIARKVAGKTGEGTKPYMTFALSFPRCLLSF